LIGIKVKRRKSTAKGGGGGGGRGAEFEQGPPSARSFLTTVCTPTPQFRGGSADDTDFINPINSQW